MRYVHKLTIVILLLTMTAIGFARKRDPLTEAEADQLREVRLEPAKRLKLFAKFADVRLDGVDTALNDAAHPQERPGKIHDLLDDFAAIVDEMNDNLDMFQSDKILSEDAQKEYRKGLKELIAQDGKLRARLRTLQHDIEGDPKIKSEAQAYVFALQDADAALKTSLDTARQYLAEKSEEKPKK